MKIVGNGKMATILIFAFIAIFATLCFRCSHGAEIDLRAGSSFGPGKSGPVLGLDVKQPIGNAVSFYAGTLLWGATAKVPNNWSWESGIRTCRWRLCANLGASYLQRIDAVNGAHTNYNLEFAYLIGWKRVASVDLTHLSDAGTTDVNLGRNAALISFRLQ